MDTIIIILAIAIVAILFGTTFGKRLRIRASGTADEVITKDAGTIEGARAYYSASIEKKTREYQEAHGIYTKQLGKIESYETQLRELQKDKMQYNLKVNNCVEKNDDEAAKVYLKKKQDAEDRIGIVKTSLDNLVEDNKRQKELVDNLLENLNDLKSEKEKAIMTLDMAESSKSLRPTEVSSDEEDKMLEKVREGVRKATEEANGNRIAYDNSASVQEKRLDKKMKEDEIERQLQELKAARNK